MNSREMSKTRGETRANSVMIRRKNLRRLMTSRYPLNEDIISQHPYVDRISVGERKQVDFIYQYTKTCNVMFQRNNHFNNLCNAEHLIGKPRKFPKYGMFQGTFTMKTYGSEVSIFPWQNELHIPWNTIKEIDNYVYLEFHEAVYPIRVSIYEVYNPGYIIEIWAQNSNNLDWSLLWNGSYQIIPPTSRVFSPSLQMCDFKTKKLKLKFKHNMWNNYTMIDAVMLIGSSELIHPNTSEQRLINVLKKINGIVCCNCKDNLTTGNKNNLTTDDAHLTINDLQKKFFEQCDIRRKTFCRINLKYNNVSPMVIFDDERPRSSWRNRHALRNSNNRIPLSANKSQKLCFCGLSILPYEIILKILKNLDLLTLCRMNQVNRYFNNLTRDPLLYTCLNIRYIWNVNPCSSDILCYFIPRCKYLQQLDLTFSNFSDLDIIQFLDNCGEHLTHLRLTGCRAINNFVFCKISMTCKNLKVLDLTSYRYGFSHLENLENLEYLNLSNTFIDIVGCEHLCKMLKRNQRMRELNLKNSCVQNLNAVLTELRNSQDLETINLRGMRDITSESIDALAGCKNLRKINLHINDVITNDSLSRLFFSCQRLEEVHLSGVSFNHHDLKILMCKNLIKLCVNNTGLVTPEYSIIFEQCPKLQEFYMARCISYNLINQWKIEYPKVSVSASFHCIQ